MFPVELYAIFLPRAPRAKPYDALMTASEMSPWIPAGIGFVGVVVGAGITQTAEVLRRRETARQERVYLAVLVCNELDRFVEGCRAVVGDDGTYLGQPAGPDGTYVAQKSAPEFKPDALQVNWKLLDAATLAQIFEIPRRLEEVSDLLHAVSDNCYDPDGGEWWEARSYEFAKLGLQAAVATQKLRKATRLPMVTARPSKTIKYLAEAKSNHEAAQACLMEAHLKAFSSIPPPGRPNAPT